LENVLQNYDEFANLKALQSIDISDEEAIETFKIEHHLTDKDIQGLQAVTILTDRETQDYRSSYNDIRDWWSQQNKNENNAQTSLDWEDVVFEVDLLKSQEINLDYILELTFDYSKKLANKPSLIQEVSRVIRASLDNRAKESLITDFINQTNLNTLTDRAGLIEAFYIFAQAQQQQEAQVLIGSENLNPPEAKRFMTTALKREFVSENGTELNAILPKMSPLNPQYLNKKQTVFQKISAFVEKFKGVGGVLEL
jgi:type I restriction enzyme R subunit